jgi:hypothetical protein
VIAIKCGKCPAQAEPGKSKCLSCLAVAAERQRHHKAKRLSAGLCPADGKPLAVGKSSCADCLRKQVARVVGKAKQRRADGLCWGCGEATEPSRKMCAECLAYFAKRERERNRRNREAVIAHYGNQCECCGLKEFEFLAIDHVNGGGRRHRREGKLVGPKFYVWIIRNGYPAGVFRVLCHNCNSGRHHNGGVCPHVEIRQRN